MPQSPKNVDELMAKLKADAEAKPDPYGRRWDGPDEQWEENLDDWGPIFDALRQLHGVFPDMRFGQLVSYLAGSAGTVRSGDIYGVPDPHLLRAAQRFLRHQRERLAAGADESVDDEEPAPQRRVPVALTK